MANIKGFQNGAINKDPASILPYTVDWSQWLATGDTIATSAWVILPVGTTVAEAYSPTNDDTTATVWLEGGTPIGTANVTNTITTVGGMQEEFQIQVQVVNPG